MKNALVVGGVAVAAIVIGGLVFLYGGENFSGALPSEAIKNNSVATDVLFTEIAKGTQSKITTRTNYLITSAGELEKLWKMIDAKEKPPVVDFTKDFVAAVFAGQKMTGGYAISVMKVADAQNRLVTVGLTLPGSDCMVTQSMMAPYQIISLSKTSLPFTHEDQTTTTDCSQ